MEDETYLKITFKVTNISQIIEIILLLIVKIRGICEVFISVSYNLLSRFLSFTRKSSGSSCFALSCHIGLEPTI